MDIVAIMYYYPDGNAQCYVLIEKSSDIKNMQNFEKVVDKIFLEQFPETARKHIISKFNF